MRKKELEIENHNLKQRVNLLDKDIDDLKSKIKEYENLLVETRECYGDKILELENKRLSIEHPDVIANYIEWPPVLIGASLEYNIAYKIRYDLKRNSKKIS